MRFFVVICFLILMTGCYETKRSEPLIEDGVVVQTIHRPHHYHEHCSPSTHIDSEGHVSITTDCSTDYYSEAYFVVFACQHGQFVIDNYEVWHRVNPGMKVQIRYRQLDMYTGKDDKRTHVATDFEFEDAWPVQGEWNIGNTLDAVRKRAR